MYLFDGENISFDASLAIYINSNNIPQIMIISRIYETQNLLSLQLVAFLGGQDLLAPLYSQKAQNTESLFTSYRFCCVNLALW
jgi:coproporphyrinogen III oxidase